MPNPPSPGRAYGRAFTIKAFLRVRSILHRAMLAPVPPSWRFDDLGHLSPTTWNYNLNSCVAGFVAHPEWEPEVGLEAAAFSEFFQKWQFVDRRDVIGSYITLAERTHPLRSVLEQKEINSLRNSASVSEDIRLLNLRLSVEDLRAFSSIYHTIHIGVLSRPVPFRGSLDKRHFDLMDSYPNSPVEYLEKKDDSGETWTYLF